MRLTTSPRHPRTHWSQTRFLLGNKFDVQDGEVVVGVFKMVKNSENFRDLDITINLRHDSGYSGVITRIDREFKIKF